MFASTLSPPILSIHARRRLGALATLALLVLAALMLSPSPSSGARPDVTHVVRTGETLWAIAAASYGGDPRPHVSDIEARNGLHDATIRVGQVLVLP
jgi:nucleoid-associated protein YgaU